METLNNPLPGLYQRMEHCAEYNADFPEKAANNQEATMATVLMTQHFNTRIQIRFHRLLLMSEDNSIARTYTLNRNFTHVGRSRRNHIQIKDPQVSVKHLTISIRDNTCVINDLDSSNGTFINGERLVGGQVLNDGDEIMLGKTILRFAARQSNDAMSPKRWAGRIRSRIKKSLLKEKNLIPVAAAVCIAIAALLLFMNIRSDSGLLRDQTFFSSEQPADASPLADNLDPTPPALSIAPGGRGNSFYYQAPVPTYFIEEALNQYAAGQLDIAIQTLERFSIAKENTPEAVQAGTILALFDIIREMYSEALQSQEKKEFAEAIECWDRLLVVDLELIGDRPSFFAAQAEQKVQQLSYEYALESYKAKNNEKARQLCQAILQINPAHQRALALLAKIDGKA